MQIRVFTIPVAEGEAGCREVNQFLSSHRIVHIDRHLIADGLHSVWALCVLYDDRGQSPAQSAASAAAAAAAKKGRIDYREVLREDEFQVYAKLRALRKQLAEQEGVPLYAIFTNEQLAEMVTHRASTLAAIQELDGVGPTRTEKFGRPFLAVLEREVPGLVRGDGDDEYQPF